MRAGGRTATRPGTALWAALLAAAILLFAGIGLAAFIDRVTVRARVAEVTAQARILAATATAALAFNDRQAASEYVGALGANPEIEAAAIYDGSGARFVSEPEGARSLPQRLIHGRPPPLGGIQQIAVPIDQGRHPLGTVLLQFQSEPASHRIARHGAIALLALMAALLVAVLGYAQAVLRRANAALSVRAQELAEANRQLALQIAERERVEARLRQAQKMEAIGQLTGGVAHDFNNLMQIVLGSLERLRLRAARSGGLAPGLDEMVTQAIQGAQRAATVTQRLLAFARQQPLAPKPLDVNRLVNNMSDLLRRTIGESITVETVLAPDLWPTLADENQTESALVNLAVNARDAMPEGGRLVIETANETLSGMQERGEEIAAGDYVRIAVRDTGSGMPPEVLSRAFDPFFTTKGVGRGTGLGLSQVWGFIRQSGGHVRIESEPGRGTTVLIYLPRLAAPAQAPETESGTVARPAAGLAECILVVEDEARVRELSVGILRDLGYRVLQAENGTAALAMLAREPGVQLLFTDIGLPGGMNGKSLAEQARRMLPGIKILFTSGYAREIALPDGRLGPGVELIGKPFQAVALAQKLRSMLDGRGPDGSPPAASGAG